MHGLDSGEPAAAGAEQGERADPAAVGDQREPHLPVRPARPGGAGIGRFHPQFGDLAGARQHLDDAFRLSEQRRSVRADP